MKEVHNIHNHKIKTVEGYWVLPGQTIYVDDNGKKCKKPEEKVDDGLQERVEELEKKSSNDSDKEIVRKVVNSKTKQFEKIPVTDSSGNQSYISGVYDAISEYKGNLYVGASDGLYCSTDGINFKLVVKSTEALPDINTTCVYKDKLFCGCQKGIFSYDGSNVNVLSNEKLKYINFMCVFRDNLYVGTTGQTKQPCGLFYSSDGTNFIEAKKYKIKNGQLTDELTDCTGITVRSMIVYKDTLYVGAAAGLYYSTDGIVINNSPGLSGRVDALCIYKDKLYIGVNTSLFETSDGKTFTKNPTFSTTASVRIENIFAHEDEMYIGTSVNSDGILMTKDGINFTQSGFIIPDGGTSVYNFYFYKGYFYISNVALRVLKSIVPNGATGITIEKPEDIDSIINISLNVDGEMVTPLFSKKQDNDIFIELPANAITSKFPAYNVKATIEYTKS